MAFQNHFGIKEYLPLELAARPINWYQADPVLAWYLGIRHLRGDSLFVGATEEGQIIFWAYHLYNRKI